MKTKPVSKGKSLLIHGGILIGAVILGFLLMMAAYLLPTGRMKANVLASVDMLEAEGDYPSWGGKNAITKSDQFTDAAMIKAAITEPAGMSLTEKAMLNPLLAHPKGGIFSQVDLVRAAAEGDYSQGEINKNLRYWNGYLVFLKPLLLLFNIGEIRVISMMLQGLLLFWCLMMIRKQLSAYYAFAFLVAVLVMAPITIALCMQYQNTWYIALGATLLLLYADKNTRKNAWSYIFLGSGICVAFFDLLTCPLVTLTIPLAVYLALERKADGRMPWTRVLTACIAWGIGYGVMWFGKWALATLLTGENVIQNALDEVMVRSSGAVDGNPVRYPDVVIANIKAIGKPAMAFLAAAIAGTAAWLMIRKKKTDARLSWKAPDGWYLFVMVLPLAWFFFTQNHSAVHTLYTYRIFAGSILAGFFLLGSLTGQKTGETGEA